MNSYKLKNLIRELRHKQKEPRISFYRMIQGPEFAELSYYYDAGIGIRSKAQYEELVHKLELTYCPSTSSQINACEA